MCTDIIPPWPQPFVSFKADPRLMTLCTGLENSYIMVSRMFSKERWGVATVSTPSAGHININRMDCGNVRDYAILLQNLVTYEAVKNVAFVMVYFDMPNYRRVCSRITFSCDILSIKKFSFFLVCQLIGRFNLKGFSLISLPHGAGPTCLFFQPTVELINAWKYTHT